MQITIDSMIRLRDVPAHILAAIKKDLTINNPMYIKKKHMGISLWGTEKEIKFYSEEDGELLLPRGYMNRLFEINDGCIYTENRLLKSNIQYPVKPKLRDYQEPFPIKARESLGNGVFIMPCGAGKTSSAMGVVYELQQPTLWITHTIDLLNQSMESAKKFLGLSGSQIGIIQGDKCSIGSHMTFATVQTLANRDLSEIVQKFGCIIVDECHLVFKGDGKKMRMFNGVISQFPAYYRFGLTASEFRSDGLIESMFHIIGPKLYEVEQDDPRLMTMKPKIEFIETEFFYEPPEDKMLNIAIMTSKMKDDAGRNAILKSTLINHVDNTDYCLVLGDNLDHLRMLKAFIQKQGRLAAFVCGTTPKKEREKIMQDMRSGQYHYLFATYALAKLGLDIPRLNKLVEATPKRDKTSIQQAVGRIMRPEEGKEQPVVYDIIDKLTPQLRNWGYDRTKVYRKLGCEIIGGPKTRRK
jgi:superfamily II DNA or RNA helicase